MAKVGILSMQRIINYGSFLQAYALKMMLEEMGHQVQFVDYKIGASLVESGNKYKTGIIGKLYKIFEIIKYDAPLEHKLQFILYKKQFSEKYHKILGITKELNYTPEVDVLVIGSDEVFNCVQANPNVGYSLELFGKNNKAKKVITYAASFGNTTFAKLQKFGVIDEIRSYLNKISTISVRDENTGIIIKKITDKNVAYHLDPVLAYDFIKKSNLIPKIKPKEKYIVLYAYAGRISQDEAEWISSYAKRKRLKIYAIGGVQKCADRFINCSPFEVFAYFLHAEEVITDTFHGTIFSVVTKKKFSSLVRKSEHGLYGNEEKLKDLLARINLLERATSLIDDVERINSITIDYSAIDTFLDKQRDYTVTYFRKEIV